MTPQRIQLSRKKGFNLQAVSRSLNGLEAVNCERPGKWGNPFKICAGIDRDRAVLLFEKMVDDNIWTFQTKRDIKKELFGKNLACFCPLNLPCHCDVLLRIANL